MASAIEQVRVTAEDIDEDVVPRLNATLEQARVALASVDHLVAADSPIYADLRRTLREISAAARSIRAIADYLERHPEALIKGKGGAR